MIPIPEVDLSTSKIVKELSEGKVLKLSGEVEADSLIPKTKHVDWFIVDSNEDTDYIAFNKLNGRTDEFSVEELETAIEVYDHLELIEAENLEGQVREFCGLFCDKIEDVS